MRPSLQRAFPKASSTLAIPIELSGTSAPLFPKQSRPRRTQATSPSLNLPALRGKKCRRRHRRRPETFSASFAPTLRREGGCTSARRSTAKNHKATHTHNSNAKATFLAWPGSRRATSRSTLRSPPYCVRSCRASSSRKLAAFSSVQTCIVNGLFYPLHTSLIVGSMSIPLTTPGRKEGAQTPTLYATAPSHDHLP